MSCHEGEEEEIGNLIAGGERLEPAALNGKQGVIDLAVQIAYDDRSAYFRFQWKTKNAYPGHTHPFIYFDGETWHEQHGYPRLDNRVQEGKQPAIYEDRLSMMIDDGTVPMFAEQGCWVSCHDGQRDMPNKATKAQVKAQPLLGDAGLKRSDVRKYLPSTRTGEDATWDQTKSAEEIARIKAAGGFVDLMQWRAHRSNPVGMADDGYVLEYRLFDAGGRMFGKNLDKKTGMPRFMYDEGKLGRMKFSKGEEVHGLANALVPDETGVPFDPKAGWQAGDLLAEYLVSRDYVKGSGADNAEAKGSWKDGKWTVVWTRPLDTGHPEDDKIFKEGGVYTFGFAVHDDNITTRGHHVSFPVTVGFGAKADIEAIKLP